MNFLDPISLFVGFKPYYKWITFNTNVIASNTDIALSQTVLNLIINGLPSIQNSIFDLIIDDVVLNLIINGLPSILLAKFSLAVKVFIRFKPYYKWITFNT